MFRWSLLYAILKFFFGLSHRLFYKKIIVTGQENIPKNVPIIFAPNHQNALMDPLAVIFTTNLQPVFLARADIFRKPVFRYLLHQIKMLPVYRVRDGLGSIGRNDETFDGTTKILEAKQSVALFPEAQHHGARFLLPIKKGVPRIAFRAEETNKFDLDIHIIPTGINFSSYSEFRSTLQVNYGTPIKVKAFKEAFEISESKGYNALRDAISEGMRPLMIDIQDKDYYDTIDVLRKLYANTIMRKLSTNRQGEISNFQAQKEIIKSFHHLGEESKASLKESLDRFLITCHKHKIPAEIVAEAQQTKGALFGKRFLQIASFPLFLVGYLLGLIPYALSNLMIGKIKDKQYDSTFRFVISSLALPIVYSIYAYLITSYFNLSWWGCIPFILFFPLGTFALDYRKWWKTTNERIRWSKIKPQHKLYQVKKELFNSLDQHLYI